MPHYLIRFSNTPETWAKLVEHPEDRREAVRTAAESIGGKLHGYWYAFGEQDGYVLIEAPDSVSAAAMLVTVAATGAVSASTTVLLTVEEMLAALGKAKQIAYRPPGG